MTANIDALRLSFDANGLAIIQIALGVVMFGVALDLRPGDFVRLARRPRAPLVGLLCQFFLLPALAFALARLIAPTPSMALGMILVAACPGGNVSNFLTQMARGSVAVSVGMTAVSTLAALVMTPLNFAFWGSQDPDTARLLREVALDAPTMVGHVAALVGVPVAAGMGLRHWRPALAARLRRPLTWLSVAFFVAVVVGAFAANWHAFLASIALVFWPVATLNAAALGLGYACARAAGLDSGACRAVALEVGIQNSGLGLVLAFTFFEGLGGIAVVAAWWGIWHVVAGGSLALYWSRRAPNPAALARNGR